MEDGKVFSRKAISIATYIGGPIVSGYLISRNFALFGEEEKSRKAIFIGILFFIIVFEAIMMIPEPILDKIPDFIFPAIYTAIVMGFVNYFQEEKIDNFLEKGGSKASGWTIAGISFMGLILTLGYIFLRASFIAPFEGEVMTFGKQEHEIYYDAEIEVSEIEKLGQALIEFGYFGSEGQQNINIKKNSERYRLYIYVSKEWWNDQDILESLNYLERKLSNSILSLPVDIIIFEETISGKIEKEISIEDKQGP